MTDKSEIYGEITNAFKHKYGELGFQFAQEFLTSVASYHVQTSFKEELKHDRVRSHLLLFWRNGWLKSSLCFRVREILGHENVELISDISKAALRGTVEYSEENSAQFNAPKVLRASFIIATELGTVTGKGLGNGEDLNQLLLQILEEGTVNVDLSKFAKLTLDQRQEIEKQYPMVHFKGNTAIEYDTHSVWIAGTYNARYVLDSAFSSRWEIMIPQVELNSELTKYIDRHRWTLPTDIPAKIQHNLHRNTERKFFDAWYEDLPDEVYAVSPSISPRFSRAVKVYKVCNKMYWDMDCTTQDLVNRMKLVIKSQGRSTQSIKEDIQDYLRHVGRPLLFDEIKAVLPIDGMTLAKELEAFQKIRDTDGTYRYLAKKV